MFEYNGQQYTYGQVEEAARKRNMSIGDYVSQFGLKELTVQEEAQQAQPELGKMTSTAQGAAVEENKAPDMESSSEPGLLESLAARTARGFVSTFKGVSSAKDALIFNMYNVFNPDMTTDEKKALYQSIESSFTPGLGIFSTDQLESAEEYLSKSVRENGQSVLQEFKEGNYGGAAEAVVGGALESIPSLLAAFTGYGGIALFGASVAGNKFDEEFEANPEQSLAKLSLNAVGSGAIEAGFEMVTRGLGKTLKLIPAEQTAKEAAKQLSEGAAKAIFKKLGGAYAAEGASEAATEVTSIIYDKLTLDKDINAGEAITRAVDAFAIGGFVGGSLGTVSAIGDRTTAARERAEYILAPLPYKDKMVNSAKQISALTYAMQNEQTDEGKELLKNKINEIETEMIATKQLNSINLKYLQGDKLSQYASNTDEILKSEKTLRSDKASNEAKDIAKQNILSLTKQNSEILRASKADAAVSNKNYAKSLSGELNIPFVEVKSNEEIENITGQKIQANEKVGGVYDGGKLYWNEGLMNEQAEFIQVSAGTHEVLHPIMNSHVLNKDNARELTDGVKNLLTPEQSKLIDEKIKTDYNTEVGSDLYYKEYFQALSGAIVENEISIEKSLLDKSKEFFQKLFGTYKVKVGFNTSEEIFEFIKEYSNSAKKGKQLSEDVLSLIDKASINEELLGNNEILKSQKRDLKDSFDRFSKDKEGNRKYSSMDQFKNTADQANAYMAITETNLLDGIIKNMATRDGIDNIDVDAVKENLSMRFLTNFDPAKNESIFGWMTGKNGALNYAYLDEKKRFAGEMKTSSIDVEAGEVGYVGEIVSDENFDDNIDLYDLEQAQEEDLIIPSKLLDEEAVRAEVEKNFDKIDLANLSFKKVENLVPKYVADFFLIPEDKVVDLKKNLSSTDMRGAQRVIFENSDVLMKLLPKGAVTESASEKLLGTSTGLPNNLLKAFYTRESQRRTEAQGLYEFKLNKNITKEDFLKAFGIDIEGKPIDGIGPRNPEGQTIKTFANLFGKLVSNVEIRRLMLQHGGDPNFIQDIAAGKSESMFSKKVMREQKTYSDREIDLYVKYRTKTRDLAVEYGVDNEIVYKELEKIKTKSKRVHDDLVKLIDRDASSIEITRLIAAGKRSGPIEELHIEALKTAEKNGDLNGVKLISKKRQTNNALSDIELKYSDKGKEKSIYIEVKSSKKDQYGSFSTSIFASEDVNKITFTSQSYTGMSNFILGIKNKFNSKDFKTNISKLKSDVLSLGGRITNNGSVIIPTDKLQEFKYLESRIKVEKSLMFEFDETLISNIYNEGKDAFYISVLDSGTYYLGSNPLNLNVPKFEADIILPGRFFYSKNKSKNETQIRLRFIPSIKNGKIKSNEINLTTQEGIKKAFGSRDALFSKKNEQQNLDLENRMAAILSSMDSRYNSGQTLDRATAKNLAATRVKRRDLLAPSADDFIGLLYRFLDKGKVGEEQYAFFKEKLIDPFSKAYYALNAKRQTTSSQYKTINKANQEVVKKLKKDSGFGGFTYEQALRVWLFQKAGYTPNGLSEESQKALIDIVKNNPDLQAYGEQLHGILGITEYWVEPDAKNWQIDTIKSDMVNAVEKVSRKAMLQEWIENKNEIFSENNMNKILATYGPDFVDALKDMLYRMENGSARPEGTNKQMNEFLNWIRGSVAVTMFFNTRSALLQQISAVNFINLSDNNPIKAAAAVANIDQYAKDIATIFNSDYLKERRGGLKTDVNAADLADAIRKGGVKGLHAKLLQLGFSLTQIGDSIAISLGGATFYRNRLNTYLKQGLDQASAEKKAFLDFQEISEETQQSARPDRLAKQQTDVIGRVFLAFQNTPMQYTRLTVKAAKDLIAGRGDKKTNISKIVTYMVIQNVIFSAMQQAMFSMLFEDDEEENKEDNEKKKLRLINNVIDTFVRGTGMYGAILSTAKNTILKFAEQEAKQSEGKGRADHAYTMIEAMNISPAIGIKMREMYGSIQSYRYNKDKIKDIGLTIENPALDIAGSASAFALNVPLDRAVTKMRNLKAASDAELETWQRMALVLGWNKWNVGVEDEVVKPKKTKKRKKLVKKF